MENKINIAELLKDCPKGMELDCINYDGVVTFEEIFNCPDYPIKISVKYNNECVTHTLTKYGQTCKSPYNKCVIFPKGKTTWEGFHRPFKDGDIIYVCDEYSDATLTYVAILKQIEKGGKIISHCFYNYEDEYFTTNDFLYDGYNTRFATEEEKDKLFKIIKDNGYEWNPETKTLEKLSKFKCGDILANDDTVFIYNGIEELSPFPSYYAYAIAEKNGHFAINTTTAKKYGTRFATEEEKNILFEAIKNKGYKWYPDTKTLTKLPKFKDGDVITCNNSACTFISIFKDKPYEKTFRQHCSIITDNNKLIVDNNKLIVGNKYADYVNPRFATEEEKQKLFDAIRENGYRWNSESKTLENLVEPKFKIEKGKWYVCIKDLLDNYANKAFCKGDIYLSTQDGSLIPSNSNVPFEVFCPTTYFKPWTIQDAKDGDIVSYGNGWTCIFKCIHGIWYSSYCFITIDGEFHTGYEDHEVSTTINGNVHLATEEEKQKLFDAIKANGYKWNNENKTLEKLPKFKVGDRITYKWHNTYFTDTIVELAWDEERNDFICSLKENDFKYYMSDLKKCETGVPKTLVGLFPVTGGRYQMIVDEYYDIINENGKYYVVKKKPYYPQTYEDCCSVLVGREPKAHEISFSNMSLQLVDDNHTNNIAFDAPMIDEINILYRLIMCRNAYWKIAGEEMGLDKPWKPSLKKGETHYAISNIGGKITYEIYGEYNAILTFPTKEIREIFHKNFKDEIEICKKFL